MNANDFITFICFAMGIYSLLVPMTITARGMFYITFYKAIPFFGGLGLLYAGLYLAGAF